MPLLDHFRPPLKHRLGWSSLHANLATRIADRLTVLVPPEYTVEETIRLAGGIEIDIAASAGEVSAGGDAAGGAATAVQSAPAWSPPAAMATMPAVFPMTFEVLVFDMSGGRKLVAAVELVSPANKDRVEERRAFATKVASYLNAGVAVVVLDVVTTRRANLHNAIVRLMETGDEYEQTATNGLYAAAYQPVIRAGVSEIDLWFSPLRVGDELPTMPLRISHDLTLPVDFESAYMETCRKRRLI